MDEQQRNACLDAMGITRWVRRGTDAPPEAAQAGAAAPPAPANPTPPEPSAAIEETPPAWLSEAPPPDAEWVATETPGETAPPARPDDIATLGWEALQQRVARCNACELHRTRTRPVFGVGDPQADLLIIGEAPGAEEDRKGEPFVGRAGQLLNAMLKAIGLTRDRVYIANILKCRPPGNRDPRAEEALHCEPYLMRQIALIRPRVILAVGRVSAQNLLKSTNAVGRLRGRVHRFGAEGIPLVVTYHPAYLLRSPEQKAKSWQDLQQALALLQK